jgi:hypothetical protein
MPQVQRTAAQAVRQGRRGVQGQRFLPQRQPRNLEVERDCELVQEQRQLDADVQRLLGLVEQFVGFLELVVVGIIVIRVRVVIFWVFVEFQQFDAGRRVQLASYPQARCHRLPQCPRTA